MQTNTIYADALTRQVTAFDSFQDFVTTAIRDSYTPTLRGWDTMSQRRADSLASLFDRAMVERGSAIRAWPYRTR